jgi:hypothetical protein
VVTCVVNDARGRPLGTVMVDLPKARVFYRLQQALVGGEPGVLYKSLEQIDTGKLPLSTLARVYSPEEIRGAIQKRRSAVQAEGEALDELLTMLEDPAFWSAAQGGEQARDRFGIDDYAVPRSAERDTYGGGGSLGRSRELPGRSRPPGKGQEMSLAQMKSLGIDPLRKSQESVLCRQMVDAHGWKVSRSTSDGGLLFYHNGRPGNEIVLHPSGEWEHEHRGKSVAAGGPGALARHLATFHHD